MVLNWLKEINIFNYSVSLMKRPIAPVLSVIIGSAIFSIDHVVLCEGSSDTAEGHKEPQSYGHKHLLIGLAVVLISIWLVKYSITPGTSSSSGNTEVITYTTVPLPDLMSEESRAAIRAVRDSLNLIGESLEGEK